VQGRLDEAFAWVRAQGLSAGDSLSYLREYEHVTLARVLLAQAQRERGSALAEALDLLARLQQAAQAGGRSGSAIEIGLLQALAHKMRGDWPAALAALEGALVLAEPEGYRRIFIDEGSPMQELLVKAAAHGCLPAYTARLLAAFAGQPPLPSAAPAHAALVEPLSQRELEVLRLFKTELSGPEIAQELMIGLSTVRTHTKSIYSKLAVTHRQAAVNRAEELGLI
jgi:LuxR family maltose regulon positive regulatory protein